MIKYTCKYPGCGFTGTDLETKEHLNLGEDNDTPSEPPEPQPPIEAPPQDPPFG